MVANIDATRTRYEIHVVATDLCMGITITIKKRERFGCVRDRLIDQVLREQDSLAAAVSFQAVIEQSFLEFRSADVHSNLRQDALGVIENPVYKIVAKSEK